jgi:hypothetical protein
VIRDPVTMMSCAAPASGSATVSCGLAVVITVSGAVEAALPDCSCACVGGSWAKTGDAIRQVAIAAELTALNRQRPRHIPLELFKATILSHRSSLSLVTLPETSQRRADMSILGQKKSYTIVHLAVVQEA